MTERFDVAVIGGGPAGCAAAIAAARRGRKVVLLERGRYPRHKVCGEFVSAESLELLRSLLAKTSGEDLLRNAPRIGRTRVFLEGGSFEAPIDPPAASISRYQLDQALWNAAIAAGVDARQGCGRYSSQNCGRYSSQNNDGVFVVSGDGPPIAAGRVVLAAGRVTQASRMPRHVTRASRLPLSSVAPASRRSLVGLKAHFRPTEALDSVDLYFGASGYCGIQPLGNGLVNVCALLPADAVKNVAADRISAAFAVHERLRQVRWEQVTETVATGALSFDDPEPLRDGIVCAGDAAGFIDPFLGDGISLALQTGALAGQIDDPELYASEYRKTFLPVFRRAARLRKLLAAPMPLQKTALLLLKWPGVAAAVVERTRAVARNACLLRPD